MKRIFSLLVCLILLSVPVWAQNASSSKKLTELTREDITEIKIIGSDVDRIHLFLKHHNKKIFRVSSVTEEEAHKILSQLSSDSIRIETQQALNRVYFDIVDWQ